MNLNLCGCYWCRLLLLSEWLGVRVCVCVCIYLLSLSSTESSAREISSMRNTPPSFMACTNGPSFH